jgi:hypothetical protein
MEELWRPVPGHEGFYEVSNLGQVRSVDRVINTSYRPQKHKGILLKRNLKRNGYYTVRLTWPVDKTYSVHSLVASAFHGPKPPGYHCCHNNGIKTDNRAVNLRWGTPKENRNDMQMHGTLPRGETNGNSRLRAEDVIAIRASNKLYRVLAVEYCVSLSHIKKIKRRLTWAHI